MLLYKNSHLMTDRFRAFSVTRNLLLNARITPFVKKKEKKNRKKNRPFLVKRLLMTSTNYFLARKQSRISLPYNIFSYNIFLMKAYPSKIEFFSLNKSAKNCRILIYLL